jgi:hypothetical protein
MGGLSLPEVPHISTAKSRIAFKTPTVFFVMEKGGYHGSERH